jgi:hypothetical protein
MARRQTMLAWRLSTVAIVVVAVLGACWIVNGWNPSRYRPGRFRRATPCRCQASRSLLSKSRRQRITIRPLPPELRAYYAEARRSTEAAFSTAPHAALHELDQLVADALRQCGYPVDTFEHDVTEILPAAPQVVEDYRTAHSIALGNDNGIASEPDLRLAMFHYHSLLRTLLEDDGPGRLTRSQR